MPSYEYKVEIAETVNGVVEWWETEVGKPRGGWTHDSATTWLRQTWPDLEGTEPNARARIMRRRGPRSRWTQHRKYIVQPNGIVRRTDR